MKTINLLFAMLITTSMMAQLNIHKTPSSEEIGKITNLGQFVIDLKKYDDEYRFSFRNTEYQTLVDLKSFSMNEESYNQLYDFIMDNWDNPPKDITIITLDDSKVLSLHFTTLGKITNMRFILSESVHSRNFAFSAWLNKKRINKLFGK